MDHAHHPRAPLDDALAVPFFKSLLIKPRLVFPGICSTGHGRRPQMPSILTGRARRVGHRAGDDRGGLFRTDRLSSRELRFSPLTCNCISCRVRANSQCSVVPWSGPRSGFLWFNAPPAMVFMGDTGSLSVGGALRRHQRRHQTRTGARHDRRAVRSGNNFGHRSGWFPSSSRAAACSAWRHWHHHFEKKGWAESTIVIRFWIIATVLALIGLSTLKLR